MSDSYRTVITGKTFEGELVEKKSRFIAVLSHAENEGEARELLESERKKHYSAKHHVSAYILYNGKGRADNAHSSDDGEPSGTAGKPILDVVQGAGLKDVVIVVTRYFGGTLLGTGGLTRAYSGAASIALQAAEREGGIKEVRPVVPLSIRFDYASEGKVRRILDAESLFPDHSEYSESVLFTVKVPEESVSGLEKRLVDSLAGKLKLEKGEMLMDMVLSRA